MYANSRRPAAPGVLATKKIRQAKIAEMIEGGAVYSQQALAAGLGRVGIRVTQATLSRDLAELGVVKGPEGYGLPGGDGADGVDGRRSLDLRRVLREFVRALDAAGNLVILKTDPGHAHTVAAHVDRARWPEIIGTIAGDDTIFAVVRRPAAARRVLAKIREVVNTHHDY